MKISRIAAVVLLLSLVAAWLPGEALAVDTTPMYRLYNPNSGEHFYTGSVDERDNLVAVGWNYEGIAWHAPISGGAPVHRVFNPNSGDHHYTMSQDEVDMLVALGWVLEGIGWYGVVEPTHTHNYTATVTAPTCENKGYTTYFCPCGDTYIDGETAALGHSWGNWEQTKAPTVDAEGQEQRKCGTCGKTETRSVDKLPDDGGDEGCTNQSWGNWTSDDNGSYRSCTACGEQQIVNGSNAQYANDVITYINEYRVAAGLNPLTPVQLSFGLIRAEEITIQMNHNRLDGSGHGRAECIAGGIGNAKAAADAWYNSSGHRPAIMNPDATRAIAARCGNCWVIIISR